MRSSPSYFCSGRSGQAAQEMVVAAEELVAAEEPGAVKMGQEEGAGEGESEEAGLPLGQGVKAVGRQRTAECGVVKTRPRSAGWIGVDEVDGGGRSSPKNCLDAAADSSS